MSLSNKSQNITLAIHAIIWGILLSLPLFIPNVYNDAFPLAFDLLVGIIHLGLFYFNAFFLFPKLMNRRRWWLYIIALVALIVFAFHLKYYILEIVFPETIFTNEMYGLLGFPNLLFIVASIIYRVVLDRINYERTLKEREAQELTAELKFLRSQINPHFLFNVLNSMVSMARHKSDQLEPTLIRLSGLMRYMLYESDAKKVPLSQEIEYLKSYIELQKLRFEEDVEITVDIEYDHNIDTIEPMLLIPFVENAFKHGIALVENPYIHIELKVKDQNLLFSVENKFSTEAGQSKDRESGIGLANIKARLKILYPDRHVLVVDDKNGIFNINLNLPLS